MRNRRRIALGKPEVSPPCEDGATSTCGSCAVADCNRFKGAQIALNMAQSTFSAQLGALEAKLGSRLRDVGGAASG